MSADAFFDIVLAPDPLTAFDKAVEAARYDYGHSGYTGTIAEKDEFKFFGDVDSWHYLKMPGYFEREVAKKHRKSPKERLPGTPIPARYRDRVRQLVDFYEDKWGPAICYRVTGTAAIKIKESHGRARSHDNVYVFCGYASA
jgi:hypothetical protein